MSAQHNTKWDTFYSKIIRNINEQSAVYHYDDLNGGMPILESKDPTTPLRKHSLNVVGAYLPKETAACILINKQINKLIHI